MMCLLTPALYLLHALVRTKTASESTPAKQALDLMVKGPLLLYNLAQVGLCSYMIWGVYNVGKARPLRLYCNEFNTEATDMADVLWLFYVSKMLDFCDTLFIILRGKWRQLSFLHVYHHMATFFLYWINVNVAFDGDICFTIVLNASIHVVMYLYYFASTAGVRVPKSLKAIVTHAQMTQFVAMNVHALWVLSFHYGPGARPETCPFPPRVTIIYLVYIVSLLFLFNRFRISEYVGKAAPKVKSLSRKPFHPASNSAKHKAS
eukprot:GHVT01048656.1.p1 GENE.GHVT01048656.1~~GHVT01048656.1.p1  ORF type:complete len:262 (-),score=43.52 GHVT01048656.1:679-1464(-)